MEIKGKLSSEQIDLLKKEVKHKYGENTEVFEYEAENKYAYLRSVDRDTFASAASKAAISPTKSAEIILENIWLGGDEDLKKIDQYWFGLIEFVEELIAKKKGNLTKL